MKTKAKRSKTSDAVEILNRMAGNSPELKRLTEEARINAGVAKTIRVRAQRVRRERLVKQVAGIGRGFNR